MQTLTITIGRNIGLAYDNNLLGLRAGEQMPKRYWDEFRDDVDTAVLSRTQKPMHREVHGGVGYWEGSPEESLKLTYVYQNEHDYDLVHTLRDRLRDIARNFWQDAIALSIGETILVESDVDNELVYS